MGYRYGEHKYGEGLYSRWPDWWHGKDCQKSGWETADCKPALWAAENPPVVNPLWSPLTARTVGKATPPTPKPFRAAGT